jgi:uncharacterized membrane protein
MNWMEGFELTIVINRPVEEAFGFLSNLENDVKWRSEWVDAKKTSSGPIGIGTRFRLLGELFGRQIPTVYEVIEYEPNRCAAWKAVSGPLPLTFQRTFEGVDGGTHLTIRYDVKAHGFLNLAMSLLAKTVKRQHQSDLRKVKELMETGVL